MSPYAGSTDHRYYAPRLAALGAAAKFAGTLLHASFGACFEPPSPAAPGMGGRAEGQRARVPLPDMSGGGSLGHGAGLASLPGGGDRQTSVTAGTLFADTHLPLRLWFEALWHVTSQKSGASALGLQRVLGPGSYRKAWNSHKLRRAMVRPGRERLQGIIEVDEIFIGGPRPGKRGRGAQGKVLVVVAAQQAAKGIGRIRLTRVADASARSLEPAIAAAIEVGSQVRTGSAGPIQAANFRSVVAPSSSRH